MRIAIFGYGGMGREVADFLKSGHELLEHAPEIVFVSDDDKTPVQGHRVIGPEEVNPSDRLLIAIGTPAARQRHAVRFPGIPVSVAIAPSAVVSPDAVLGEGAIVCEGATINNGVRVGEHLIANCGARIAHDCVIGDYVTISPGAIINGNVHIEDGAYIGAGAIIRHGLPDKPLRIGAGAVVGMGAVVLQDVPAGETVVGNPARKLREHAPIPA